MKTLTTVLIAGGESRRMGVDKATLQIRGEPLWARQLRVLQDLRPARILVSARQRPTWCPQQVEVVLDDPPLRGPLSGLAAAFKAMATSHILFLAVDMPLVSTGLLDSLWTAAREGHGVVPVHGRCVEPLCAIYPRTAKSVVLDSLGGNNFSLQKLVRELEILGSLELLPFADAKLFSNLNLPSDLSGILTAEP